MTKKKIVLTITLVISIILLIVGATYAYWGWNSNNIVMVNITTHMGGIGLEFDGGGTTTVTGLAPATCTHATYANMVPLTIDRYNETSYPAKTTLTLKLISFTWSNAKPTTTDLSNVKFAVTTSNNSCINPVVNGDLASAVMNNSANTSQSQTTKIFDWDYVLPPSSGTSSSKIHENYYLYIWIDPDYTFRTSGSNALLDPLQGLTFTITWTASSVDQYELPPLKPGDYVTYTPSISTYPIDTSVTGYTGNDQSNIIPNELTSWRVLKVNDNGSVEIISDKVSSTRVKFEGKIGYKNFVGYLNDLASQYETPGITVGSRHFGYNGQTEYITDETYFTNPAPWACSTDETCTPDPDDYESSGGGDMLYLNDYNLVNTVLGTVVAKKQDTSRDAQYWSASRRYLKASREYDWCVRYIDYTGRVFYNSVYYYQNQSGWNNSPYDYSIRPIVILKSGLTYTGSGTEGDPWVIS